MADEFELDEDDLQSLLTYWAKVEPQRCHHLEGDCFEVKYYDQWITVKPNTASHGAIIAAVLEACQEHSIYCKLEFSPRYEEEPNTIQVGCIHKVFRYREEDDVIAYTPLLLLTEYLEQLEGRPPSWVEELRKERAEERSKIEVRHARKKQ